MFILIDDYREQKQKICEAPGYFLEAKELCEEMALNFIIQQEGLKYLTAKKPVKKGYFMVKEETAFSFKVVVFYKNPNGYIYSGETERIAEYKVTCIKFGHEEYVNENSGTYTFICELEDRLDEIKLRHCPDDLGIITDK